MTAADLPPGYPAQWEADVVLRDGSVAHLRPITPADAEAVRRFHAGQSDESIYMRFFAPLRQLRDRDVTRFTNVDYVDRAALVATVRGQIIGIGRYDRITPTSAEVAFNIADSFQGKGIGSVLLEHLAVIAWEAGIEEFTPFQEISEQAWDRVMDVNLKGVYYATQAVLPDMVAVGNASEAFSDDGGLKAPRTAAFLDEVVRKLVDHAARLA